MAFRARGQPPPSRGHLLDFGQQHEKNSNGMVHRLKTRISSWKLLSRRSKTHANLASLCPETAGEPTDPAQEHRGILRTRTAADLNMLASNYALQLAPSPHAYETDAEAAAPYIPQFISSGVDHDPFADEDMFNTSLNSILRAEPDLLGSSTPRRFLSVLEPKLPTVRRQSVSKVEKRSSLVKQESGLNRAFLARMRSSSDAGSLLPFEIPERRSSIVCLAGSQKKQFEEQLFVSSAKNETAAQTGGANRRLSESGRSSPRTPSRRSSICLPRRSSTTQDLSRPCYHRLRPRRSSLHKRTPQLNHKSKNQEIRASLPPSPARSDISKASSRSSSETVNEPSTEAGWGGKAAQHTEQKLRQLVLSPSIPLLLPTPPSEPDLGETVYKCFPVDLGKKHPSPTKLEWEDIKLKWQMGVRVRANELCV
ncbi:hypothetical protein RB595_008459 [Gaeumannomyces hyphopodioides]